jgi:HK97 family phage prohead protease
MTIHFDSPQDSTFSVDPETRTIRGLALPFNSTAKSKGRTFQFAKGTVRFGDISRVKLLVAHDPTRAVGYATEIEETDEGLFMAFKVARGAAGDEALTYAEDRVWDGLSVGISDEAKFSNKDGVFHAVDAPLMETSLTPFPAFDEARLTSVAATSDDITKEGSTMTDSVESTPANESVTLSTLTSALRDAFPQGPTEVRPSASFEVEEELPYRFDGVRGAHSFVEDMRDAQQGNADARQRLEKFGEVAFAVTTANASTLNPTRNRPELYVPQLQYSRPLWDLVSTGTVEDVTPFTIPKFSTATGLVGNHTQGTEPTPGAFSATNQTVTPAPMSGKIEINREVLDQGGSPQADTIIWGEMLNAYYEAIEAKIATTLNAVPTAELNLGSVTDAALVNALTDYLASLQFVRGGNRFTAFAADNLLFPKLVSAADTTGRKLLPVLGPANAQGQTDGAFDRVQIGNQTVRAAWALSTALGTNVRSFSFVPSSVWAWASAPKKFVFEYQVKSVDMAIWGYSATAVLRDSDVKPIDYAVAD